MFFTDLVSSWFHKFITAMHFAFSTFSEYRVRKLIVFSIWVLVALGINTKWMMKDKVKSDVSLPITQLTFLNFVVIITCLEVELIWNISVEFLAGDIMCKIIKWLQTTSLMLCAAFISQTVIMLKYPMKNRMNLVKLVTCLVFLICPILSIPQVRF